MIVTISIILTDFKPNFLFLFEALVAVVLVHFVPAVLEAAHRVDGFAGFGPRPGIVISRFSLYNFAIFDQRGV